MSVAVELDLTPGLDEVRELAREHNLVPLRHTFIADCETPVSAYLKLRGSGPSFLLESAEQGQRVGRWSFLGFRPRATVRMQLGEHPDPYAHVADELGRYRIAPLDGLPPFAGGAVGLFGYDLVRSAEPSVGDPNPDEIGIPDLALMITDLLVAFDHLRHEVTILANVFPEDDLELSYQAAADAIADVRRSSPARSRRSGAAARSRPSSSPTSGRTASPPPSADDRVHPRRRRLPGGPVAALDRELPGRGLLDLPRPARDQPQPLHVLPRLRGLPDRGRLAGVAREGGRPARGAAPDRRHAPARGLRPPSWPTSCSPTPRSAPST